MQKSIVVRMEAPLRAQLEALRWTEHKSLSEVIREACQEHLARKTKKKGGPKP